MSGRYIGVDVGGTKVSVGVLEGGELGPLTTVPTELADTSGLIAQLAGLVQAAGPADAIGIGVPSVVDFATGSARASVNVPLQNVPLRALLFERLATPVFVDNDATLAALCEAYDDALAVTAQTLVMFTVGTGVGGGVVIGGRVHRGATGSAGEIGHMIVAADLRDGAPPAPVTFPALQSLEAHAAGRALDALGHERGLGDGPAVVAAARAADAAALDALRILGERLGVGVAGAINLLDPDEVVIGGGVSAAGDLLLEPVREAAGRFVLPGAGTRTTIRLARWGAAAGVRGAALLARSELAAP